MASQLVVDFALVRVFSLFIERHLRRRLMKFRKLRFVVTLFVFGVFLVTGKSYGNTYSNVAVTPQGQFQIGASGGSTQYFFSFKDFSEFQSQS